MRVVLLADVKGIGRRMEMKDVSDGYARNFLFPRKLAVPATAQNEALQRDWKEKEIAAQNAAEKNLKRLEEETITLAVRTGSHGEVFSSITVKDIAAALEEKGFKNVEVFLPHPVRELGTHTVQVSFSRGIKGNVTVVVTSIS